MKSITFIGGIHGSGKGKICQELINRSGFIHLTASEILKWNELSLQEEKLVKDIQFTQNRLVTNLKAIIKENEKYLLDGHYSLLNKFGMPEKVPTETFEGINPEKIILVIASPQIIKCRLEKRDLKIYDLALIKDFQALEIASAKEIRDHLKIPLYIINSEEYYIENLLNFLK